MVNANVLKCSKTLRQAEMVLSPGTEEPSVKSQAYAEGSKMIPDLHKPLLPY